MADSTVLNLTPATALLGPEVFYVVQGGNDRKLTATQILTFIGPGVSPANPTASVGLAAVNGAAATFMRSDGAPALSQAIAPTWTGQHIFNLNGAASTPPALINGTWFTGGSSTTTKPQLLVEPTGTTSTGWSTSGTGLGVNAASGFAGNLLDLQVAGSALFTVRSNGYLLFGGGGNATVDQFGTATFNGIINNNTFKFSTDVIIARAAAATLQFGGADAASPVAQTSQVQNVVAGNSNVSGVNWTLNGSLSTGSGTSGDIIFQTGGTGAGATSQNALVTALTIKGATQQVIMVTTPRISVAPTANSSASTTITSGADSSTNCGHRIQFNLNGVTYWIPCSSVAF